MGYKLPTVTSTATTASTGTGAENILNTTGAIIIPSDSGVVLLFWSAAWVATATTLSGTFQIRRTNALTGASVYVSGAIAVAVGQTLRGAGAVLDAPGAVGPLQYILTVTNNTTGAAAVPTEQTLIALAF